MKKLTKLVAVFLAALMVLGCLAGVTAFAADAEATWTDGTTTVEGTLAEMGKQASSKGGTVKLLKDVSFTAEKGYAISSNSSFTFDLNGHTLTSSVGGVSITTSEKGVLGVFTVKNGTIISRDIAISCNKGGLVVDGVTAVTEKKQSIIYNETSGAYNKDNLIQNSTIHCSAWGILSFNNTKEDQSAAAMTVKNSTLVSTKSNLFVRQKAAGSPTVLLGEGMKMYTVASAAVDKNLTVAGEAVTKADGTHSITVGDVTTEGLNLYTTPEKATVELEVPTAPAKPATPVAPAAAEASWTDGKTVVEGTLAEVAKIANDKGGSVKFLRDVTVTNQEASFAFNSKKSVTIDLDGKTLTTEKGAFRINKGADGVTVIKNGTIVSGTRNVSVVTGAMHLQNLTMWSNETQNIDYYEASDAFNHQNLIENCTVGNPVWGAISFNSTTENQEKACITVKNSTLIAAKGKGSVAMTLQTKPEGSKAQVALGEGVKIYSYAKNPANAEVSLLGEALTKSEGVSVTILDKTYDLMNEFATPATATVDLSAVIPGPKPAEKPAEPATPATPAEPATPSTPAETEKKEEPKTPSASTATATFVEEESGAPVGLIIGIVAAVAVIAVVAVVVLKKKKQ